MFGRILLNLLLLFRAPFTFWVHELKGAISISLTNSMGILVSFYIWRITHASAHVCEFIGIRTSAIYLFILFENS